MWDINLCVRHTHIHGCVGQWIKKKNLPGFMFAWFQEKEEHVSRKKGGEVFNRLLDFKLL